MTSRLGAHLMGAARALFQDNIRESTTKYTYDEIVKMMRNDFLSSSYRSYLREKVHRRKQGLYESIANYIFIMRNLINRMDRDNHMNEEERVERFLEGMLPQIAAQILPCEPKNFGQLLEKVKLVEKALMRAASKGEHVHYAVRLEELKVNETPKKEPNEWSKAMESMTKTFSDTMAKILKPNTSARDDETSNYKASNTNYGYNKRQSREDRAKNSV